MVLSNEGLVEIYPMSLPVSEGNSPIPGAVGHNTTVTYEKCSKMGFRVN